MNYSFDQIIERRNAYSTKWLKFSDNEVIPMWIADMDFSCPEEITNAMHKHLDKGVFGYTDTPESLTEIFIDKIKENSGWEIKKEWVVWVPGGVVGLNVACKTTLAPGEIVMVPSPIYAPFTEAPENMERGFIKTDLKDVNGRLELDFESVKDLLSEDTKMFSFCNPHNPGGTVFRTEEIEELSRICKEKNIIVCSDEIHSDLVLEEGATHIPFASFDDYNLENSITITGPCKTYNLAGFPIAAAVIPNNELRSDFQRNTKGIVSHIDSMAFVAAEAAYSNGEKWHSELLNYLKLNREILLQGIREIEGLSLTGPEAGFLGWIDCRESGLENPGNFFIEEAKVGVHDGAWFGNKDYVRINFGCPSSVLEEALLRIKKLFHKETRLR